MLFAEPGPFESCGRHGASHQVLGTGAHRWPCCQGSVWGQHLILAPLSAGCSPTKCGRGVTDAVISREEARRVRRYLHASPSEREQWGRGGEQRLTAENTFESPSPVSQEFPRVLPRAGRGLSDFQQEGQLPCAERLLAEPSKSPRSPGEVVLTHSEAGVGGAVPISSQGSPNRSLLFTHSGEPAGSNSVSPRTGGVLAFRLTSSG